MSNKAIKVILVLAALLVAGYLYNKYRVAPSLSFNQLVFKDSYGDDIYLREYESKVVVVCFFATWCGPCMKEVPALEKAATLLGDNNVAFVLISDEDTATLNRFWQKGNKLLPVLRSSQKLNSIGIATVPTAYILNEKREIVFKAVGETDWAGSAMIEKIKSIAGPAPRFN